MPAHPSSVASASSSSHAVGRGRASRGGRGRPGLVSLSLSRSPRARVDAVSIGRRVVSSIVICTRRERPMTRDDDDDDVSSRGITGDDEASTSARGTLEVDGNDALAYASRAVSLRLATREGRTDGAEDVQRAVERLGALVDAPGVDPSDVKTFKRVLMPCLEVLMAYGDWLGEGEDAGGSAAPKDAARIKRALESVARTMGRVISVCGDACDEYLVFRTFTHLLRCVVSPRRGEYETTCAEFLSTTRALLRSTHAHAALKRRDTASMVGYMISVLLTIANDEAAAGSLGSKHLRSSALQTLDELLRCVADADALAFFLPGVVSGLTNALAAASGVRPNVGAGPSGTGSDGVEYALSAMTSLVTCVLNDGLYPSARRDAPPIDGDEWRAALDKIVNGMASDDGANETRDPVKKSPPCGDGREIPEVVRDDEWLEFTTPRVTQALEGTIPHLVKNHRASVRKQIVKSASSLIRECSNVLDSGTRSMFGVLLTLAGDNWTDVSSLAVDELTSLRRLGHLNEHSLNAIIKNDLSSVAENLRLSNDETGPQLQRLLLALEFSGEMCFKDALLSSPSVRNSVCSTIVQCLLIESHDSTRNQRYRSAPAISLIDLEKVGATTVKKLPRKVQRLRYFPESSMYETFAKILRFFGKAASMTNEASMESYLVPMAQFFLSTLRDTDEFSGLATPGAWQRNATAHIIALNELVYGAMNDSRVDKSFLLRLAGLVVEEYVCSSAWEMDTRDPDTALLLQVLMEGLGIIGESLGADYIRNSAFLTSVLCPLLDKLGDLSVDVRETAGVVLKTIAESGEYTAHGETDSPIGELVTANADYVIDMLSRQIRHLEKHSRSPQLFEAILRRTGAAKHMVKLLAEPVRLALRTFLIMNREKNHAHTEKFLLVTKEYCSAVFLELQVIRKQSKTVAERVKSAHPTEPDSDDELTEVFTEELTEILPEDIETTKFNSLERVRSIQSMVSCAVDVLRSMSTFLETPHAGVRTLSASACGLAIECLSSAESTLTHEKFILKVLKAYGSRGSMPFDIASLYKDARVLPHIHNLWPHLVLSLSTRFQISIEAEAFEASLKLLLTMARCSGGEFISKRLNSDLWPILMRVLTQGVGHIEKKNRPLDLLTVKDSNDVEFSSDWDVSIELTNIIRIMICETLESIADSADAQRALQDVVASAVPVVGNLSAQGTTALRLAAAKTMLALAKVNSDEVWLYSVKMKAQARVPMEVPTPCWCTKEPKYTEQFSLPPLSDILPECGASQEGDGSIKLATSLLNTLEIY